MKNTEIFSLFESLFFASVTGLLSFRVIFRVEFLYDFVLVAQPEVRVCLDTV